MKKILLLLSLLFFCSCNEEGSNRNHFISGYYTYSNIDIAVIDTPIVPEWGYYTYRWMCISADIDEYYHYYDADETRKAIYNQFAEKYGDVGYNRYEIESGSHLNDYATENITAIELICLEDVGENHPAGSSVAEMFEFESHTPYDYIQSRYTNFYNKRIVKRLDQVTNDDLYLIGTGDEVLFFITPINQEHCQAWGKKLRLTLNYENQHPISKEFVLEKGEY